MAITATFTAVDPEKASNEHGDNGKTAYLQLNEMLKASITDLGTLDTAVASAFITVSNTSSLANERALTAGTGITLTDGGAGSTMTVAANVATQANQEAATSTTVFVTPGRQQYHPSACKGWIDFDGTGTIAIRASYNVTSITDNGTGDYTVTWDVDMSSANYCVVATVGRGAGLTGATYAICPDNADLAAGTTRIRTVDAAGALADAKYVSVVVFGDQ